MKCLICSNDAERHHIKTRGSGGKDDDWNILMLCRSHHVESHKIGQATFARKYGAIMEFLMSNGWEFLNGKLFHANTL